LNKLALLAIAGIALFAASGAASAQIYTEPGYSVQIEPRYDREYEIAGAIRAITTTIAGITGAAAMVARAVTPSRMASANHTAVTDNLAHWRGTEIQRPPATAAFSILC
jgi:hypothetical protein